MNRSETLKARIRSGKPVFGTFVKNNCPNLVEMLGVGGVRLCHSGLRALPATAMGSWRI